MAKKLRKDDHFCLRQYGTVLIVCLLLIASLPVFSQDFNNTFQSIGGKGHFRFIGKVSPDINHFNLYMFSINRYMDIGSVISDGYSAVIKGKINYVANVVTVPASIINAMENKLKTIEIYGGDMYEFIFPYSKGPNSKGYLLVFVYAQETWGYIDCAQAWYICTE